MGNTIWGDLGDTCLIHIDVWRCFQYKDSGAGELGVLSFCSEIPCSTRRVCITRPVCITHYECSKLNGNIVVMTKNTCYFRLDRVWNIHVETTENTISRSLDFNIFWGSSLPQEIPRGWRLWGSQYFPLLRNMRIITNTPSQTPATRLIVKFWQRQWLTLSVSGSITVLFRNSSCTLLECAHPN